jgi:glutamate/tyrosine decarboxylase-like PLP-dependent enzyme
VIDFREDDAAALEWTARYLERVGELPVLAQVKPGELSAQLPAAAPGSRSPLQTSSVTSTSSSSPRSQTGRARASSPEENEQLEERVNGSGEMFITHTKLDGRYVLRLAIGNARTTEDDVRRAWEVLNREAER